MEIEELWIIALNKLLNDENANNARSAALNMIKPLGFSHNLFILISQNQVTVDIINKQYIHEIEQALSEAYGSPINVSVFMDNTQESVAEKQQNNIHETPFNSKIPHADFNQYNSNLNKDNNIQGEPDFMNTYVSPEYVSHTSSKNNILESREEKKEFVTQGNEALFLKCTFDSFVTGGSNEFACSVAKAVAEQPGTCYNPLFIYGNSGLGKTHLLIATANAIHKNYKNMSITYSSASDFLTDYVNSVKNQNMDSFNKKYNGKDVLLIDDVQYLGKKTAESLNQLFNIFNDMVGSNKQIILSADRSPKYLNMDDRVKSRFMSGMLADVKEPAFETRVAIIKQFYKYRQENSTFFGVIPDEVIDYIAENSSLNIREIEGTVTRLIGYMSHTKKESITVDEAARIIKDFLPSNSERNITVADIQAIVEEEYGVSHEDIISAKRSRVLTSPRHVAIYLSRLLTEESLESIGQSFGGRDHATIMYSVNKIEDDLETNNELMEQIERLTIKAKRG